ncbi:MAG: Ig-like domain-containing protein [Anaerolineae bacterium]|jgi:hypothetical protein|nr:Ig-like domain-containing protein [Anaerolineae bacterium]
MKRLVYVLIILFLCVALIFAGYIAWRYFQFGEKPIAQIISPESIVMLESGDEIAVAIYAEAQAGISRIVLLVDGEVYAEESASGENTLTLAFPWYATSLGSHTLEALVYDSGNQVSEPASLLIGVRAYLEKKTLDFIYIPPAVNDAGSGGGEGNSLGRDSNSDSSGGETGDVGVVDVGIGQILPVGDDGEILGEPISPDEIPAEDDEILGEPISPDEEPLVRDPLTEENLDFEGLEDSQDNIPTIAVFDVQPSRNGQSIQIAYHVEARDDLGVDRLMVSIENTLANGSGAARTLECAGEPICATDDLYTFSSEGSWALTAYAVDTSGQASERQVELVEVIGTDNALLPAIVLHDPATIVGLFDERAQENEFNLDDLWIDEVLEEEEEEACYRMSVDQQANGNLITLTYNCTIETPHEDTHYSFEVSRVNDNDPRRHKIFKMDYPEKKTIHAGESFTFLDENANCGANVVYSASGWWVRDDEPRHWIDIVGSGGEAIVVADCTSDDLQIIGFDVSVNSSGAATLAWNIVQNPNWPSGDISVDIVRYQPRFTTGDILFEEPLFKGERVQAESMEFTWIDQNIVCDTDYFYTLNLYQGPFSEPESHLATAHTQLTDFNCSDDKDIALELELTPGFIYDTEFVPDWQRAERPHSLSVPIIQSKVLLPSNFAWPEGDEYKFVIQIRPLNTLAGQPSERWSEYSVRVNDHTPRELAYNMTRVQCGGIEYTFSVYLFVDGSQRNNSPLTTMKSPPCLPSYDMIPDITQLTGYNCGKDAYCVDISTSAASLESRDPDKEYFDIDTVTIFREIRIRSFAFGDVPEEMDPDQLAALPLIFDQPKVIDANLLCSPAANDNLRYYYRIAGGTTSDTGHILYGAYGDSRGYITVPACGETYNEVETGY